MTRRGAADWWIIGLMLLACIARVVHLDADPHFPTWIQYVVDEGRWNETARNLALFGAPDGSYVGRLHLTLSPGYQAVNFFLFKTFGVTFWSARFFAAICGILIVISVYWSLRRYATGPALALGIVILGFETNLLAESRLGLPEIPALLGMLLAFLVLVVGRKTAWNALLSGVLAAAAIGLKGTSLLIVPVLWLVIIGSPQGGPWRQRGIRALAFAVGLVLPIIAGLILAVGLGLFDTRGLTSAGSRFFEFLAIADPRLMVWRYFESTQLEIRNLMLLGAWFCSWIWFHRDSNANPVTREIYLMSGLWAGWWLVLWTINDYSPGRYVVHFVVPATIHLVAGLSLLGTDTFARIAARLGRRRGLAGAALLVWLVLPSAIFATTILTSLGGSIGVDASRASIRVVVIVALAGLLAVAMRGRGGPGKGAVAGFLTFPVFMALLWLGGRELGSFDAFWKYEIGTGPAVWLAVSTLVASGCWWVARQQSVPQFSTALFVIVIVLLAATFLWQGAHPVVAPTYSIRDASRQIGQQYSGQAKVLTLNASSLFLGNTLRYREISRDDSRYDVLVLFEHNLSSRKFLQSPRAADLVRVQTYPLTIHPRYEVDATTFGPADVGVYKQM
jgi:hypothetical protein